MTESDMGGKGRVDLSDEQVYWDLGESLTYSKYLGLDQLLSAQRPISPEHDEMLFIVIHQASELWIKLCLHEITAAIDCVRRDDLGPSFKMLARVSRIQSLLVQSWDVLSTLTPSDYSRFRNHLGRASGFQSHQYRLLEFSLGNKNAEVMPNGFGMIVKHDGDGRPVIDGINMNEFTDIADRDPITGIPHHRYVRCRVEQAAGAAAA